jgi:proteic killer suppression protein
MIIGFKHKGLELLYKTSSARGVQTAHARKLNMILQLLDVAQEPADMGLPGLGLHPLKGDLDEHWAVSVNANWRVTFHFVGTDVELVDYQDYH